MTGPPPATAMPLITRAAFQWAGLLEKVMVPAEPYADEWHSPIITFTISTSSACLPTTATA